jgi:hypothetical protein
MEERQVNDDSMSSEEIKRVDGYFTMSKPYIDNNYIDVTGTTRKTKPQYIEYSKIARFSKPYNSFIKNPNLSFKTSHIGISSVNNFMKGLVLVLANASLFVPIAQIGGNKTKKNKAKKKINNNN